MRQERTSGITHIQQPFFHQDLISELALKAVVLPVEMRGFRITHAPVFSHNPADSPGINAAVQAVGDFFGGNRTNPEFFGVFPSRFSSAFHELPAVYLHIKIISLWTGRVKVKFTFLIYAMHFFRMARPIGGIGRVLIRSSKGVMLHPEEIDGPCQWLPMFFRYRRVAMPPHPMLITTAFSGQTSGQLPQLMQWDARCGKLLPSDIVKHFEGQAVTQIPHPVHFSQFTKAIYTLSHLRVRLLSFLHADAF